MSNNSNSPQGQKSSVPIFLYRQLAEELEQVKRANSDFAIENERLTFINQQLREEAIKLLSATQGLQEILAENDQWHQLPQQQPSLMNAPEAGYLGFAVDTDEDDSAQKAHQGAQREQFDPYSSLIYNHESSEASEPDRFPSKEVKEPIQSNLMREEVPTQSSTVAFESVGITNDKSKKGQVGGGGVSGLLTVLTFALVILSAFVAGFVFIPPLLNQNSNNN
jgi:hypothetical protein